MKIVKRIAAATALSTGLGLAGLGAASVAAALPGPAGPMPAYHWCPGQGWDQNWGNNWDANRCHDDFYGDNDPHDQGHWRGNGQWHPDNDQGWDRDRQGGQGWDNDHQGGQGWDRDRQGGQGFDRDRQGGPGGGGPGGGHAQ